MPARKRFIPPNIEALSPEQMVRVLQRALRDLQQVCDELDRTIPLRLEVPDVALTTSDLAVRHGLGAPVRGWETVRLNANAVVYEGAAHTAPAEFINLRASAACTVTLRFF